MRDNPQSTASVREHPIHPMFVPFPIAFFIGAFITDIVYWGTGAPSWALASYWLLLAGLIGGVLAGTAGLIDFIGDDRIRGLRAAWIHMIGNLGIVVLQLVNWLIRIGDPAGSVLPWGILLSLIAVAGLLVTGWMGWHMVYRHGVGLREIETPQFRAGE